MALPQVEETKSVKFKEPESARSTKTELQLHPFLRSSNEKDETLLLACIAQDTKEIKDALKNGGSVNATTDDLHTPLHIAAENGNSGLISELLKIDDIKINLPNSYGSTPLLLAVRFQQTKVVKMLLQNGAAPNIPGRFNQTVLHEAVSKGNYYITKMLLRAGAEINKENCFGESPLQIAIELMNTRILNLLLTRGANLKNKDKCFTILSSLVLSATSEKHLEMISYLVNHAGARINIINSLTKDSLLHLAAMRGDNTLIDLLLELGANINAKDMHKETPVKIAIYFNNWSVAHKLADVIRSRETEENFSDLFKKMIFSKRIKNKPNMLFM